MLECESPTGAQCATMWQSYAKLAPSQTDALNVLHAACDLGGGKMLSVDVWESAEQFQNFVQNQLIPAIAEVNPDAPQAAEPEIREIYDLQQA